MKDKPMSIETRLKKLEAGAARGLLGLSFTPACNDLLNRPLIVLSDFDLDRLEAIAKQNPQTDEGIEELGERLSVAAKDGLLRSVPSPEVLLAAIEEERRQRPFPMARHHQPDHRPDPRGGPGVCSSGLYHSEADPDINPDAPREQLPTCATCARLWADA